MRYVFHPEALTEYAQAVQYYTEQRVDKVVILQNSVSYSLPLEDYPKKTAALAERVR